MNNKGQVNQLPAIIVSFVLIGLMVAVSVVLLSKFQNVLLTDTSVSNETVANGSSLTYTDVVSVSQVRSNTTKGVIPAANWTLVGNAVYTNNVSLLQVDYVYAANTTGSTALVNTRDAITPITTDWLPILVIVAIVGVILMLVFGAFSFYKRR